MRYSSTWVESGAPPLTMKRTRPPKADLKGAEDELVQQRSCLHPHHHEFTYDVRNLQGGPGGAGRDHQTPHYSILPWNSDQALTCTEAHRIRNSKSIGTQEQVIHDADLDAARKAMALSSGTEDPLHQHKKTTEVALMQGTHDAELRLTEN